MQLECLREGTWVRCSSITASCYYLGKCAERTLLAVVGQVFSLPGSYPLDSWGFHVYIITYELLTTSRSVPCDWQHKQEGTYTFSLSLGPPSSETGRSWRSLPVVSMAWLGYHTLPGLSFTLPAHHLIPSPIWFTEATARSLACWIIYIISSELIWARKCKFLSYLALWQHTHLLIISSTVFTGLRN